MDTISISSLQELHHSLVRSTYCGLIVLILRLPSWAGQILQRRQFEPPACGECLRSGSPASRWGAELSHLLCYFSLPPRKLVCLRDPLRVWCSSHAPEKKPLTSAGAGRTWGWQAWGLGSKQTPLFLASTLPFPQLQMVVAPNAEPFWRFCNELPLGFPSCQTSQPSWIC